MKFFHSSKNTVVSFFIAAAIGLSLLAVPQAVHAQDGSFFSSFTSGINNRFQRFYLSLPGAKSGEAVLNQSTIAMENEVTSMTIDAQIDAGLLDADDEEVFGFDLSMQGPVAVDDFYDVDQVQQDMTLSGEMTVEGTTLSFDADIKVDGETVYFKVNKLPALPFLSVDALGDQWLRFDPSTLTEDEEEPELSADQRRELMELNKNLIENANISKARKEQLDGTRVFVTEVGMPLEVVTDYIRESGRIHNNSEAEIESSIESVNKVFETTGELKFIIYTDQSTYYTKKFEMPLSIDLSESQESTQALQAQALPVGNVAAAEKAEILVSVSFSDYNQPVEFEVPEYSRDAAEVFAEIIGAQMGLPMPSATGTELNLQPAPADGPAVSGFNSKLPGRPAELPELSAEERAILEEYGIDPDDLL